MFRFLAPHAWSIAAGLAIAALALAADPVPADSLFRGTADTAATPAPAAAQDQRASGRSASLGERFGLPRIGGPRRLSPPPPDTEPIPGVPLSAPTPSARPRDRVP